MSMTLLSFNTVIRKVIISCLSTLITQEKEILDDLNNLKLRSLRYREARVLGVRNPSQLYQNDREIWKRNFKMWFEAEIQGLNMSLMVISRKKDEFIDVLNSYLLIEVFDNRSFEAVIYLKQHSKWNGSAQLVRGRLTEAQREEFESELIKNEIPVSESE